MGFRSASGDQKSMLDAYPCTDRHQVVELFDVAVEERHAAFRPVQPDAVESGILGAVNADRPADARIVSGTCRYQAIDQIKGVHLAVLVIRIVEQHET